MRISGLFGSYYMGIYGVYRYAALCEELESFKLEQEEANLPASDQQLQNMHRFPLALSLCFSLHL